MRILRVFLFSTLLSCRGWQGLIAQGCHSSILIIDPKTAQTIQVLERHKANVVKVSSRVNSPFLAVFFFRAKTI